MRTTPTTESTPRHGLSTTSPRFIENLPPAAETTGGLRPSWTPELS